MEDPDDKTVETMAGTNVDRCCICGAIVPEGTQVCPICLRGVQEAVADV